MRTTIVGGGIRRIAPQALRAMLGDGGEIALVDVREGGPFSRSHLLVASNVPLSQLEVRAPAVLPRRTVRLVLTDDGEGLAERAAAVLSDHGYSDVAILDGGVSGWAAAGYELFSGTGVPSKAFGEFVEHACGTPRIEPRQLKQWRDEGRDVVVVDSRPLDEFRMVSIPGATDCPGAELVLRVPALLRSAESIVVVNCAGRTRSIIGAQSLRNAGLPNPVFALKNGTMGWHLAGLETDRGRSDLVQEPEGDGLRRSKQLARRVAERFGVRLVEPAGLAAMQADASRTTYLFDVRLPEQFAAGHRPGSVNAPGGQLVQATDTYAAVRNARIVLIDRHEVQAVMTAHWLLQMGWEDVHVLRGGLDGPLQPGPAQLPALGEQALSAAPVHPSTLHVLLRDGAVEIVDVGDSYWYRAGRIPGSWYAMRSRLPEALASFPADSPLVFVCGDGRLSRFAAQDAIALGHPRARWLKGGRAAWRDAGRPTEACTGDDDPKLLTATDDMWYPPWARRSGVEEAMQQYLTWEVNLVAQLEREPYLRFSIDPAAA
jgi:rhodanese-related sulfurtransferase